MQIISAFYRDLTDGFIENHRDIEGLTIFEEGGSTLFSAGTISRDPRLYGTDYSDSIQTDKKNELILLTYKLQSESANTLEDLKYKTESLWDSGIVIHLEIKDEVFFDKIKILKWIQLIIHLITLLLFIQMLYLFTKSNRLKRKLESQKNLVILGSALRTLTHEMKNPLAAIRLQSGLINRIYPDKLVEETQVINSEVNRLSRLMDTVKDYLREPLGNREEIEVNSFLNELKTAYPDEINWQIPPEPCRILFDRDRLRSVMENLINNALESETETEDIRVEISRTRKLVYVSISDRGKGIPPEIKSRMFDPFFTTKSRGSGAGLMIVKRFLEAAGGDIYIESVEGERTDILFRLPLLKEDQKR